MIWLHAQGRTELRALKERARKGSSAQLEKILLQVDPRTGAAGGTGGER